METNKIDNNIKDKLKNRSLQPSNSAWERLSSKLDEQPKEVKKGWFFYLGIAASILLLFSVGFRVFTNSDRETKPKQQIVIQPLDTVFIDEKRNKIFNEVPVEEAVVNNDRVEVKQENNNSLLPKNRNNIVSKISTQSISKEKNSVAKVADKQNNNNNVIDRQEESYPLKEESSTIAKVLEPNFTDKKKTIMNANSELKSASFIPSKNSSITVNADDLLYAVSHTNKEVKEYYAKYQIDRESVLKTIENQLKKANLTINPNTILAEVERTIKEEDFKNNFLQSLKNSVTNIATAIASRND